MFLRAAKTSDEINLPPVPLQNTLMRKEGVDRLTSICRLRTTSRVNEYKAGHLHEWAKADHVVNLPTAQF